MKHSIRLSLIILFGSMAALLQCTTIAFDLTKSETAGNADWTIGTSPNWVGAYSDFGLALRNMGYQTTILTGSTITANQLANVDVLVIPEPQDPFSTSERTAILNFVNAGGGLFMIADHDGSDRNNNGWDSRRVYNESLLSATNFGISFDANSLYADPTSLFENPVTQITNGLAQVGMYAGCSITPTSGAICHIWLRNSSEEGLVTKIYGQGKVAAYGDSSPFDDSTGNSGNDLHDGWHEYDNSTLATNVVSWLLGTSSNPVTISNVTVVPSNPHVNQQIEVRATISAAQPISIAYLYWKTTGAFNPVAMSVISGNTYRGYIPAQNAATNLQCYLQAITSTSLVGYYPEGAPANLMTIIVSPTANDEHITPTPSFSVFPNPASLQHPYITIKSTPGSRIEIFNAKGKMISSFESRSEIMQLNNHLLPTGSPSGIYYLKSKHGNKTDTVKLLLLD